jgi:hypothetical protein
VASSTGTGAVGAGWTSVICSLPDGISPVEWSVTSGEHPLADLGQNPSRQSGTAARVSVSMKSSVI